jgi:predicted nucleic acid-binding protein
VTGSTETRSTNVRFVDTNVLLYAVSDDPAEQEKAELANEILEDGDLGLSVQVLQEFYVQATRATRQTPLTHEQAAGLVVSFTRFAVQELSVPIVLAAVELRQRYDLSYWDAAILEAARTLGCDVVLSEDLDHGTDFGGVRVEDPFRGT